MEGWSKVWSQDDWDQTAQQAHDDYDRGAFLLERLGAERHLDPPLMAVLLLSLRRRLIQEHDSPTMPGIMSWRVRNPSRKVQPAADVGGVAGSVANSDSAMARPVPARMRRRERGMRGSPFARRWRPRPARIPETRAPSPIAYDGRGDRRSPLAKLIR